MSAPTQEVKNEIESYTAKAGLRSDDPYFGGI